MNREEYEQDLKDRQNQHLDNIRESQKQFDVANWKPCAPDDCPECLRTGSHCLYLLACDCPKCHPQAFFPATLKS